MDGISIRRPLLSRAITETDRKLKENTESKIECRWAEFNRCPGASFFRGLIGYPGRKPLSTSLIECET